MADDLSIDALKFENELLEDCLNYVIREIPLEVLVKYYKDRVRSIVTRSYLPIERQKEPTT